MGKPLKKKISTISKPLPPDLSDASDTQLLRLFSKAQRAPWPGLKISPQHRPLRVTPRRRYRRIALSGFFDALPLELIDMIFLQLDYVSLSRLSATNTKAESFIKTRPYYKLIVENCHLFLGELRRIGFSHVPCAASIYHAICNPTCSGPDCTRLAGLFFLPTCQRYCYQCVGKTPQSRALCTIMVEEEYHIPRGDILDNLLCLRSSERSKSLFVLEADVINLTMRLFGEERRVCCSNRWWSRDLTSLPLPFVDPETKGVEQGRLCRACNAAFKQLAHCWEDIECGPSVEELVMWRKDLEKEESGNKVYGKKQLLQHLRSGECPHAQEF
ncbi:hypothetical protein BJX64DRAFT_186849 [Aspergillus heterothallicus]